ncbi:hypothetical protein MS3_00002189 [Schistosoma haematobium]|uniref:Uncharacterized protein n=1 Tax=Schistosoma haematobium TaxID=6185 RepID=A0A922LZK6_SCHHA|nr:hypothetical protein MS3_00002189 [Schistosoma haematobium]KAH9596542.1 hypothetical protein MS3_00002189 [Schistosoma haematobium]
MLKNTNHLSSTPSTHPNDREKLFDFGLPPSARKAYGNLAEQSTRKAYSNINLSDTLTDTDEDYSQKDRRYSYYDHSSTKQNAKIVKAGSFNCTDSFSYENGSSDWNSSNYRHFPRFKPSDEKIENDTQFGKQSESPSINRNISPVAIASSTPKINHKTPTVMNITNSSVVTGNSFEVSADMKQDKYLKSSNIVIVHAEDVTNNYKEIYPRFTESLMHSYNNHSMANSPKVSNRQHIQLVYAKPSKLRRDVMAHNDHEEISPVKMSIAPVTLSAPTEPYMFDDYFIIRKPDLSDIPEQKLATLSNQFGELNDSVERVIIRIFDSAVVPGGALRGVVYICLKEPIKLNTLFITTEMVTKTISSDEKQDMEKRIPISYTVLSDDPSVGKRMPIRKFTCQEPEFMQSPVKEVDLSDPCFSPYIGPVQLAPGDHAIPFAFPLESDAHPSILLKGKVGFTHEVEIIHRYYIYGTIRLSRPNENNSVTISTDNLNVKVLSCGPPNYTLPNGGRIPAIMKTFTMENRQMLIQIENIIFQEADDINIYIFTDEPVGIRYAEAYLLRIFHIPGLKVSDTKALYKLKKYPPNVFIDGRTEKTTFTENLPLPFSEAAEIESGRLFSNSQHLPSHYRDFRVSCESLNSTEQSQRTLHCDSYKDLPRDARKAGCHLTLNVPINSVPQSCLESLKITYYIRVLIHGKRKVMAYSLPISVVEQRTKDYKMRYLGEGNHIYDPEYLKLKRDSKCSVS